MRMNEATYLQLLTLVTPEIEKQNTVLRQSITPHERLTATLRFLATGRSYRDMQYSAIISKQSLSCMIPETCRAIYIVLKKYIKFPETEKEWIAIADEFERKWQFSHCLGAVDGKHVRIIPPPGSRSYYFNYKGTHSIVLMAIVNANCEFIYCNVGTNGRHSDGGVLSNTVFYERLQNGNLNIPKLEKVLSCNRHLPYVFIVDEAFALRPDFLKPYSRVKLNKATKIFNYRLSRARRVVENAFGILAAGFRIFHTAINLKIENTEAVVMACLVLHNFLRRESQMYTTADSLDRENIEDGSLRLGERCDLQHMHNLQLGKRGAISEQAKAVRENFKCYFNNEGAVPWQDKALEAQNF